MAAGIGERVRALRQAKGWSGAQLARKAGISQGYLSDVENGKVASPTGDIVGRLARSLGTSADFLLGQTDDPSPPAASQEPIYIERRYMNIPPPGWEQLTREEQEAVMQEARRYEEFRIRQLLEERRRGKGEKG